MRHARILLPSGDFMLGDVEIRDRKITQVAPEIAAAADKEIDATGLTLLPCRERSIPKSTFANPDWSTKKIYTLPVGPVCGEG